MDILNENADDFIFAEAKITSCSEALAVLQQFDREYLPTLVKAHHQLKKQIRSLNPIFARGYRPWEQFLRDLITGVLLLKKQKHVADSTRLQQSLAVFSLDAAITLIEDACEQNNKHLPFHWHDQFKYRLRDVMTACNILLAHPATI